jgi:hypothetical protein
LGVGVLARFARATALGDARVLASVGALARFVRATALGGAVGVLAAASGVCAGRV